MEKFITPNEERFFGENDSVTIQNAVFAAVENGSRTLVIPRYNARRDNAEWRIPVSIKIPSDFTVILDNCYMVQETGVYDNMFTNEHSHDSSYYHIDKEDKNITFKGIGNVVLSGGVHNHLLEKTTGKFGLPSMYCNNMFLWVNVNGINMSDLHIENQRWWAINHVMCRNVKIKNIHFFVVPLAPTLDGIDMRVGCNNFEIENITGRTGDDTVAMTALMGRSEQRHLVEGKETHIHDIKIRNVKSDPIRYFGIRILNHDGNKIYNIDIDTVMDTSDFTSKSAGYPNCAIGVGSHLYWSFHPAEHGDTYNINVKNVTSRANNSINLWRTLKDSTFTNVKTFSDNNTMINIAHGTFENVTFNKCFYGRTQQEMFCSKDYKPEDYVGTVVNTSDANGNIKFNELTVDKVNMVFNLNSSLNITADDFKCTYCNTLAEHKNNDKLIIDGEEK